jgi:hypothetical protein
MKFRYLIIVFISLCAASVQAQTLKGSVVELNSANRLTNVFVRDVNNKQAVLTNTKGEFEIRTAIGHTLIFSSPGYTADTLYLVNLNSRKIELRSQSIALREVTISSSRKFDPHTEYPEVYQRSKVYALSPSTWFSRSGKQARRLKHYFESEVQERHVDSVFSRLYVSSLVPLRGQELDDFITLYRPTYAFLRSNTGPSLAVYVNDSYKKWQALPPEKRHQQRLTLQ